MRLAEHPRVLRVPVDQILLPNWLLSTMQSIRLFPGETVQPWHTDDGFYLAPRPHPTQAVSVIWAIEDFTTQNGASPGHSPEPPVGRGEEHPDHRPHTVHEAIMPARVCAPLRRGTLASRRRQRRRRHSRSLPSARNTASPGRSPSPKKSQLLIAPPDVARGYSPRGRAMLGYSIHPPFIGQVDGMHPLRLVDPEYRTRKER